MVPMLGVRPGRKPILIWVFFYGVGIRRRQAKRIEPGNHINMCERVAAEQILLITLARAGIRRSDPRWCALTAFKQTNSLCVP